MTQMEILQRLAGGSDTTVALAVLNADRWIYTDVDGID